jgi:hypothetical protein
MRRVAARLQTFAARASPEIHFMKTVARRYDAGLSLAALARLGGAVGKSPPHEPRETERRRSNRLGS